MALVYAKSPLSAQHHNAKIIALTLYRICENIAVSSDLVPNSRIPFASGTTVFTLLHARCSSDPGSRLTTASPDYVRRLDFVESIKRPTGTVFRAADRASAAMLPALASLKRAETYHPIRGAHRKAALETQ